MKYPKDILEDVYWSFDEEAGGDLESFSRELVAYNKELEEKVDPKETALKSSEITVRFYKEEADEDDEREEDEEPDDDDDAEEEDDDDDNYFDGMDYTDFSIKTATGKYLTIGEILFAVHKNVSPALQSSNFQFFEGLHLYKHQTDPAIPLYILILGS